MPDTFQCKTCHRDNLPEFERAPLWQKAPGLSIKLDRCDDCDRLLRRWNGTLAREGHKVVPVIEKLSKRARRAATHM